MLLTLRGYRANTSTPIGNQERNSPFNINTILKTSGEDKEEYHLGDYSLIQYQIHRTNIIRIE